MTVTFLNVHKTLRQKNKRTKVFEAAHAVFASGSITGILAAPGAGKTTAANLTTGKLRPDLGRVQRSSLVSFPVASGGVFNGSLTGRENLAFLCRVFGFDPRPIIRFVLEFTELGPAIDKPFKLYNRDERTKLMFASCYAIPFDIYVVDESMVGGRGQFRDKCDELVRERMRTAGFVVFSSSPSLLRKYCNELYFIDKLGLHKAASIEEAAAIVGEAQLTNGEGYSESVNDGGDSDIINPR
ncbi:ABC transporter ATP-binding protein [Sinorhizobium meliloti]|uniref:ABC transporter ATP-binding protein n=1 Tax=Rhizobium meliloti TaxID=382 RepID=UPI000FDC221C|nr:ABC transporter ATP-binding protein [Sinorhizobium meliloti]RVK62326.1 ABC transporter ATP-binding protein [Sinorhizobium meliloti]